MKRFLLLVLGIALLISGSANLLFYRVIQQQEEQLARLPLYEWWVRLDINSIAVAESGEALTDRALRLIQQEVWMDIARIESSHDLLGPVLMKQYQASLDRLAKKFQDNPELFAQKYLHDSADIRAKYLTAIGANDS